MNLIENQKISAVVLTYNRKELLLKCIKGLMNQTIKLNKIYIIDNNSTDGTSNEFKEQKKSNIVYLKLKKNVGSAGGFHYGIKIAFEEGNNWIWVMDDDVSPFPDALEKMLKYQYISNFIIPSKIGPNGYFYNNVSFYDFTSGKIIKSINNLKSINKNYSFINYGCFEGMLIHRDLIKKIGYPDQEFFINFDDTFYGLKAYYFDNPILINDICFYKHLIPEYKIIFGKKIYSESGLKIYYRIRNSFLLEKKIKTFLKSINENIYVNHKIYILFSISKTFFKILFFEKNKTEKINFLVKGIASGIKYVI